MAATRRLSNTLSHLQSFSPDGLEKCRRQLLDGLNEVLLHYLYKSDPEVHTFRVLLLCFSDTWSEQSFKLSVFNCTARSISLFSFPVIFRRHLMFTVFDALKYTLVNLVVYLSDINEPVQDSCV